MQASDVTALLVAWSNGDEAAGPQVMDAVYGELRRLARAHLRRERRDHSLPATALVHEAYVKLVDQRRVKWQNRAHFFAVAAQVMRRLMVDHARARGAQKRGQALLVPLPDVDPSVDPPGPDVLALDLALERLTALDPRQGQARRAAVLRWTDGRRSGRGPRRRAGHGQTGLGPGSDVALPGTARGARVITPREWEQVKALFHEALQRPPAERATFVRLIHRIDRGPEAAVRFLSSDCRSRRIAWRVATSSRSLTRRTICRWNVGRPVRSGASGNQ